MATAGTLRTVRWFPDRVFHRLQPSGDRPDRAGSRRRSGRAFLCARRGARTHVRFHAGSRWVARERLAQGGGLDNAVVLDEYRVLNADGLRYGDEFARYRGAGCDRRSVPARSFKLLASVTAHKSGHALNNALARELLARPDAWEYVSFEDLSQAPQAVTHLVGVARRLIGHCRCGDCAFGRRRRAGCSGQCRSGALTGNAAYMRRMASFPLRTIGGPVDAQFADS